MTELKKVVKKKKQLWWLKYMVIVLCGALTLAALFTNLFWAAEHRGLNSNIPVSRPHIKSHVSE